MANEKKFLDQEGVKLLWSKLSMQDYPNNEMLIAVITAIDGELENKQPKITGTSGQFVVIGEDGNPTTKTIPNAEEAGF